MKSIVIIGASAMGREAYWYAREAMPNLRVKGFLDSRARMLDGYKGYPPILGSPEMYEIEDGDAFVCAIGDPDDKMRYVNEIRRRGGEMVSVIHPMAYVAPTAKVGIGAILAPNTAVAADAVLGECVIVNVNSSVSHDCIVGAGTSISPGCSIAGRCKIGERAFVGTGASVLPDVVLGDEGRIYIAAGAAVTKSFGKGLVAGVPARFKRDL